MLFDEIKDEKYAQKQRKQITPSQFLWEFLQDLHGSKMDIQIYTEKKKKNGNNILL